MKTNILLLIIGWIVWSSCSKDTSEPSSVKSDYRDVWLGKYDCSIAYILRPNGYPEYRRDSTGMVIITKDELQGSVLIVSFYDNTPRFSVNQNGNLQQMDSSGYFKKDSVYINWLRSSSPGGQEYYLIKGKKI